MHLHNLHNCGSQTLTESFTDVPIRFKELWDLVSLKKLNYTDTHVWYARFVNKADCQTLTHRCTYSGLKQKWGFIGSEEVQYINAGLANRARLIGK